MEYHNILFILFGMMSIFISVFGIKIKKKTSIDYMIFFRYANAYKIRTQRPVL